MKRNILLILTLILFWSCNTQPEQMIAPHSDLLDLGNPQLEEVSYTSKNKLKYLNIHCTASKGDLTKEWLLNFFKNERKWSKPGYNLVVHTNGTIDTLVPYNEDGYVTYDEVSFGVAGKNSVSINVVYTGGVDAKLQPKDTRTPAQKAALQSIVTKIQCQFPGVIVLGHRDHGVSKACPSFDVMSEYGKNNISDSSLFDSAKDSL